MRWRIGLRLSVRAIVRAPLRTALSAAGVAISTASVVSLLGAAAGAERALQEALDRLGRNLLVVDASRTRSGPLRGVSRPGATLSLEDWRAIELDVPGVLRAAPVVQGRLPVRAGGRTLPARVIGTTPAFGEIRQFPLAAGRFLSEEDVSERRRVAVIGAQIVEQVFRGEAPLGARLLVRGVPFEIIGVTRRKGVSLDGANEDDLVIVPLTTAMRRLLDSRSLDRICVQALSEASLASTRSAIAALLRGSHAIADGEPDDFGIQDQTALLRVRRKAGRSLSSLGAGLAALALILAGAGLLAVSLLSVRERYAEIGLRLAVGGRPRDILVQFLAETVMISALGGAAGLAAGAAAIVLGEQLMRWRMALGWEAVVYPLAISAAIAVISGTYPALRAARLDPVRALGSR